MAEVREGGWWVRTNRLEAALLLELLAKRRGWPHAVTRHPEPAQGIWAPDKSSGPSLWASTEPTPLRQAAETRVCAWEMQAPQVQEPPEHSQHQAAGCLPPAPLGHPAETLADSERSQEPGGSRETSCPP